MRPEPALDAGPDKLSVLVLSGAYERVHYALVLASAAGAIGKPTTLFFTGQALLALRAAEAPPPGDAAPSPEAAVVRADERRRLLRKWLPEHLQTWRWQVRRLHNHPRGKSRVAGGLERIWLRVRCFRIFRICKDTKDAREPV